MDRDARLRRNVVVQDAESGSLDTDAIREIHHGFGITAALSDARKAAVFKSPGRSQWRRERVSRAVYSSAGKE
jgi:hypothetical protein